MPDEKRYVHILIEGPGNILDPYSSAIEAVGVADAYMKSRGVRAYDTVRPNKEITVFQPVSYSGIYTELRIERHLIK